MLIKDSLDLFLALTLKNIYSLFEQDLKSHSKVSALLKINDRLILRLGHPTGRRRMNLGNFWSALLELQLIIRLPHLTGSLINLLPAIWPILSYPLIFHNPSGYHGSPMES